MSPWLRSSRSTWARTTPNNLASWSPDVVSVAAFGTSQPDSDQAQRHAAPLTGSTVPVPRKWDAILAPPIEGQTTVEDMSLTRNPFRHRRSREPAPGKGIIYRSGAVPPSGGTRRLEPV